MKWPFSLWFNHRLNTTQILTSQRPCTRAWKITSIPSQCHQLLDMTIGLKAHKSQSCWYGAISHSQWSLSLALGLYSLLHQSLAFFDLSDLNASAGAPWRKLTVHWRRRPKKKKKKKESVHPMSAGLGRRRRCRTSLIHSKVQSQCFFPNIYITLTFCHLISSGPLSCSSPKTVVSSSKIFNCIYSWSMFTRSCMVLDWQYLRSRLAIINKSHQIFVSNTFYEYFSNQ